MVSLSKTSLNKLGFIPFASNHMFLWVFCCFFTFSAPSVSKPISFKKSKLSSKIHDNSSDKRSAAPSSSVSKFIDLLSIFHNTRFSNSLLSFICSIYSPVAVIPTIVSCRYCHNIFLISLCKSTKVFLCDNILKASFS